MKGILLCSFALLGGMLLAACGGLPAPDYPGAPPPATATPSWGAGTQQPEARLGQPFHLMGGQEVTLVDSGLYVRFDAVKDDFRCPSSVICESAGRAVISLAVQAPDGPPALLDLSTQPGEDVIGYLNYQIRLSGVQPYPLRPNQLIPFENYRIELFVASIR